MDAQLFIKKQAEGQFGKAPEQRTTEEIIKYGIVNIDKPKGPTSHQVSDYVKKILSVDKAGHSGTLDPQVSGVQPVAISKATRIVEFLLTAPKEYVCVMHLHKDVEEQKLHQITQQFVGKIKQLPPIKSAIKRQIREREIYEFEILEIKGREVLFRVKCQAGTYIRKLCLHPQTEIITSKGAISAADFSLDQTTVYSYTNNKIITRIPSAVQKIPSPSQLIKITMSTGISFTVTADHELLASSPEGYKMTAAEDLKQGGYLVKSLVYPDTSQEYVLSDLLDDNYLVQQPEITEKCKQAFISRYGSIRGMHRGLKLDRKVFLTKANLAITIRHLKLAGIYEEVKADLHTFKTQKGNIIHLRTMTEELFYLFGLIASDGNNSKEKKTARYTRIKFHNTEEKLIDIFQAIYHQLFPTVLISKKKVGPKLWQLDSSNSFLATIAASLGIKSPQKESSLFPLLNANLPFIKSFLRGYLDGDGSVYHKKTAKNDKTKICLHTVNPKDAATLHKMLLKIGIQSKIFERKKRPSELVKKESVLYDVTIGNIAAEKKFSREVGSKHPQKIEKLKQIMSLKYKADPNDHLYLGLHLKEEIRKNKSQLHKLGGNLNRVLKSNIPITKGFYEKARKMIYLPPIEPVIIEKIKSIEVVKGTDYVYDMTVPETHNFLIESGFISSNCHDLGQALGSGAHMAELRRTQAGPFSEKDNLVTLNDLDDAMHFYIDEHNDTFLRYCIQPVEYALKYLNKCWIFDTTIQSVTHGRALAIPGISKLENFRKGETVAIMTLKGELVAIGEATISGVEINTQQRGIAVKVRKVFMDEINKENKDETPPQNKA